VNLLRRILPYITVALVIAIGYDGWIFFSRWNDARQDTKAAAQQQAQEARRTIELLGGDQLKILNFYATPGAIHRGQQSLICYGVNAAEHVRIEPPVEQLNPAFSHCFKVSPLRDTEYKLSAEDRAGHTVTASLNVKVTP
jgi:hypothetical protein